MAIAKLTLYSHEIGMDTDVAVWLPEKRKEKHAPRNKKFKVLYLLHGVSQHCDSWLYKTRLDWYLRQEDVIVVMPQGYRAFYVDGPLSYNFYSYLTEELPAAVGNWFQISERREDTFIAGLSMGGYGAMRAGLGRPDLYGAVASLSGALDVYRIREPEYLGNDSEGLGPQPEDFDRNTDRMLGGRETFYASENNLLNLAKKNLSYTGEMPQFYVCVGREDFLYPMNREVCKALTESNDRIQIDFWDGPGGHDWDFWDTQIVTVLKKFGLLG